MYRKLQPLDPALVELCDERDHVRIQINLLTEGATAHPERMTALKRKLAKIEQEIRACSPPRP